jgi:hypothetical protein
LGDSRHEAAHAPLRAATTEARRLWIPWRIIFPELSNQDRVDHRSGSAFDLSGGEARYRENIPLAVMSVISLAILFLFGVAEVAMRDTQRQRDSCGGSRQAAISSELARTLPSCFPPLPSSQPRDRVGCMRSSRTDIG